MIEIKTNGNTSEGPIKIERCAFDALVITRVTRPNLSGPSKIQRPRLNRNDLHPCVSLEPLIKD